MRRRPEVPRWKAALRRQFPRVTWHEILAALVGIAGGIGVIAFVSDVFGYPLLIAPFGASAVLLNGSPSSPLAQPKNLFVGQMAAAAIGVTCFVLFGETWYSIAIAVTATILFMMFTGTTHPPAGATAIIAIVSHADYFFLLTPVLLGIGILFVSGFLANLISPARTYPANWKLRKKNSDKE